MRKYTSPKGITTLSKKWKQQGHSIAMVPTMGNLHQGHLQLIKKAKQRANKVIVSIFVNPTQFNEQSDFNNYPRTLQQDLKLLQQHQVDAAFIPTTKAIFPDNNQEHTTVHVPKLGDTLCGKHRPGHFTGVSSIVARLLNICQPNMAVFGEKDYQQLLIIKKMCKDLKIPTKIIANKTIRETDGLAMSSRNNHLTKQQRHIAPEIHRTLQQIAKQQKTTQQAIKKLTQAGFKVDYIEILQQDTLTKPSNTNNTNNTNKNQRIFIAAWLGKVRLIDNIKITKQQIIKQKQQKIAKNQQKSTKTAKNKQKQQKTSKKQKK